MSFWISLWLVVHTEELICWSGRLTAVSIAVMSRMKLQG